MATSSFKLCSSGTWNICRIFLCLMQVLATMAQPCTCLAQTSVVYPSSISDQDTRHLDLLELLRSALDKTVTRFGPYTMSPSRLRMNEERSLVELKEGQLVNVVWSSTSREAEREFIPVRIPLRKGLLGLRISLIDGKNQAALDRITTLEALQTVKIGVGIGWMDNGVLQANHLHKVSGNYDALFAMTAHDRFDLFPRGVSEVFNEFEIRRRSYPDLAIEKNLLIYYPWPYYFFVNKNNPALAERLRVGLETMIDDGTFDRIFIKYNGEALRKADLSHRHIIALDNPDLPELTPLAARYWMFPALIRTRSRSSAAKN